MIRYRCTKCEVTFQPQGGTLRCPSCLRQHGLEEIQDISPRKTRETRRLGRRGLLIVAALALAAGGGALYYKVTQELPRPGELGMLHWPLLRRTLIQRGVPEPLVVDPFRSSPKIKQLLEGAPGAGPKERVKALAAALGKRWEALSPDLKGIGKDPVRSPAELMEALAAGKAKRVLSFELAALLVTLLRDGGVTCVVAQVHQLDAPVHTADVGGGIGRYVAVVYSKGQLGQEPLLVLDPLRSLKLPAWAGGRDPAMKSLHRDLTPLDDASAAGHLLALRAFRQRDQEPAKAYELSQAALKAAAPASTLHVLRARVLAGAGGVADALAEAQKALTLKHDPAHQVTLARLMMSQGKAGAADLLRRAVKDDPQYWPALHVLAAMSQEPDKSKQHLQAALKVAPEEPSLRLLQALFQLRDNKLTEAINLLKRSTAAEPSEQGLLLLYQALRQTGQEPEAARVREQLLSVVPDRKKAAKALEALD